MLKNCLIFLWKSWYCYNRKFKRMAIIWNRNLLEHYKCLTDYCLNNLMHFLLNKIINFFQKQILLTLNVTSDINIKYADMAQQWKVGPVVRIQCCVVSIWYTHWLCLFLMSCKHLFFCGVLNLEHCCRFFWLKCVAVVNCMAHSRAAT